MAEQHSTQDGFVSMVTLPEVQIGMATFVLSIAAMKMIQHMIDKTKSPPGPWGFPIIGHLPFLGKDPAITFHNMRAQFGDVFSIRLGCWPTVVINGRKAIREALQEHGDTYSGRPQFYTAKLLGSESISFGNYSQSYIRHKKIARTVLTGFTNTKTNPMEDILHREIDILLEIFASKKEYPFKPHDEIFLGAGSIIYQLCYGRNELVRDDKDFTEFILKSHQFTDFAGANNPVDVLPWLRFILPWKITQFVDIVKTFDVLGDKMVKEHRQDFDPNHLRDVTDSLIKITDSKDEDVLLLGEERILGIIGDFFGAGFGTVATTMEWAFMLMASHPEIQKKVQQEIDDVVGTSRRPSLEDKGKMVYTEATLHEINRFSSVVPLAIPHYTTDDALINGYTIKKDTVVFLNMHSMSRDPEVWGDPDVFRPERFLDTSGKINKPLLEEFLPFGTGRRKCIGEFLARMELFLFFTGILQRCSILKPLGVTEYDKGTTFGLTRNPTPYEVRVVMKS